MLEYLLEKVKDGVYYYLFFPEGEKSSSGRVAFFPDGTRHVIDPYAKDVRNYYAGQALCGIKVGQEKGTVAWC